MGFEIHNVKHRSFNTSYGCHNGCNPSMYVKININFTSMNKSVFLTVKTILSILIHMIGTFLIKIIRFTFYMLRNMLIIIEMTVLLSDVILKEKDIKPSPDLTGKENSKTNLINEQVNN